MLHVVVRAPWAGDGLARALAHHRSGDALLLAQDAAAAACASTRLAPDLDARLRGAGAHVLAHDLAARGLDGAALREGVVAIDDAAWVALVAACANGITWA